MLRKLHSAARPLTLLVLLGAAPAEQRPLPDVTGLEWLQMSVGERNDHLLASMVTLAHNGVRLAKNAEDYYGDIHKAVRLDPSLNDVPLTTILAQRAYEREPSARPALDALRAHQTGSR
jgi:hypothetical protein